MSVRSTKTWLALIADGVPAFTINNRPLLVNGVTLDVGDPITDEDVTVAKLHTFFKQRRIVPEE